MLIKKIQIIVLTKKSESENSIQTLNVCFVASHYRGSMYLAQQATPPCSLYIYRIISAFTVFFCVLF